MTLELPDLEPTAADLEPADEPTDLELTLWPALDQLMAAEYTAALDALLATELPDLEPVECEACLLWRCREHPSLMVTGDLDDCDGCRQLSRNVQRQGDRWLCRACRAGDAW